MVNFIIYEDDKTFREKYVSAILKTIGSMKIAYKITEFDNYETNIISKLNKLIGKKIYILDIEVPGKSGLDLAREIRTSGDWESLIIIITTHEHMRNTTFTSKMLALDFISKFYNCDQELKETLRLALNIVCCTQSLKFQYNGEINQIPYADIFYIEKNVDDVYSTIITSNGNVKIKKTLSSIEDELVADPRFFRTHRSCIVNLDKITKVELKECVIHMGKSMTALLSRDKKRALKERLGKFGEQEVVQ